VDEQTYALLDGTPLSSGMRLKTLARMIARDRDPSGGNMSGDQLRAKYGDWLTGPVRRDLFKLIGRTDLIQSRRRGSER
jgi:hypothetical protein